MSSNSFAKPVSVLFWLITILSIHVCSGFNYIRDKQQCIAFICGTDYYPICGSDGQTYPNSCKFSQAKCLNPKLAVFQPEACEDIGTSLITENSASTYIASSTEACGVRRTDCNMEIYEPICGSDGKTYTNDCYFTLAYCKNTSLTVVSKRECPIEQVNENQEKCPSKICPFEEDALCASNGKTYRNDCEFQQIKCYRQDLKLLYKGKCEENIVNEENCEWKCYDKERPVCGTDGQTYKNMCDFERGQCKNRGLKIHKFEPC